MIGEIWTQNCEGKKVWEKFKLCVNCERKGQKYILHFLIINSQKQVSINCIYFFPAT